MLKFGFRNKNFYPLMLLLFIFLRKCLEIILSYHPYKDNIDFIISFLIFFSQSLIGFIIYLFYFKRNKDEVKTAQIQISPTKIGKIILIENKTYISNDSKLKKICLIIFASIFNFIGTIIRSDDAVNFGKKEENNSLLEVRVRGIQIIIACLLCYYSIRIAIYRHQKFSIIIISIFLLFILIIELYISEKVINKILAIFICTLSCLFRAILDVTEKYLFDFNYINVLKMLIYEGIIGVFLFIFYYLSNDTYQKQGKNILKNMSEFDLSFVYFIILIILYIIISGLRNSYRGTTNKYYSPMSRALFESTLDPFVFLYYTLIYKDKDKYGGGYWIYFGLILFFLVIIAFFTLIYNDFIILYCFGLEHNTYHEITGRLYSPNISEDDDQNSSISFTKEEIIEENVELQIADKRKN